MQNEPKSKTPFSDNFHMLCALITHLGAYGKSDTRPVNEIAGSLDRNKEKAEIEQVLNDFPCFFRESSNHSGGARYFAVHLRYARRQETTENGRHEKFATPMSPEEIGMLINVVMQMVTLEKQESQFTKELQENNVRFMTQLEQDNKKFTAEIRTQNRNIWIGIIAALISAIASVLKF
jgi:hypothetical protein